MKSTTGMIMDFIDNKDYVDVAIDGIGQGISLIPGAGPIAGAATTAIGKTILKLAENGLSHKIETALIGLAGKENEEQLTDKDLKKIKDMLEDERVAGYAESMLEGALRSNSHISIMLMCDQLRRLDGRQNGLTRQELILSSALLQLNDYDFYVFNRLVPIMKEYNRQEKALTLDELKQYKIELVELELSKLLILQLISYDRGYVRDSSFINELFYHPNEITFLLEERMTACSKRIENLGSLKYFDNEE